MAGKGAADLYDRMAQHNLVPLWERIADLLTPDPQVSSAAHHWSFADARPFLLEAVDLISAEEAERRVLVLENPRLPGSSAITETLYAGFQIIGPGELAPAHRHSAAALRLILEGEGAYTAVNGEKISMGFGDLVLTPNWSWHDHGHDGKGPVIWLDVLDIPLVRALGTVFTEPYSAPRYPTASASSQAARATNHFPYDQARHALRRLSASTPTDPCRGYRMEYTNADGSSVMPTISAFLGLLPKGFQATPLRTTEGQVVCVVEGRCTVTVAGPEGTRVFELAPKDVVTIPCWRPHAFATTEETVIFTASDRITQQSLGLYRELRGTPMG